MYSAISVNEPFRAFTFADRVEYMICLLKAYYWIDFYANTVELQWLEHLWDQEN